MDREALTRAVEAIAPRFRSGNRIPVDKATVPASEWNALLEALSSTKPARRPFASIEISGVLPLKDGHYQAEVTSLDLIQTLGRDIDEPFVVYLEPPGFQSTAQADPSREALVHAIKRMHAAKGRYHSQHAACDLYDLLGLPCTREVIAAPSTAKEDGNG